MQRKIDEQLKFLFQSKLGAGSSRRCGFVAFTFACWFPPFLLFSSTS
jgi:hypothetical protein